MVLFNVDPISLVSTVLAAISLENADTRRLNVARTIVFRIVTRKLCVALTQPMERLLVD
jgi:hypothetical protein